MAADGTRDGLRARGGQVVPTNDYTSLIIQDVLKETGTLNYNDGKCSELILG